MPTSPIRVKSELEKLREKNIKERDDFFASLVKDDPDFADVIKSLARNSQPQIKKPKVRNSTRSDPSFKFTGHIPSEKRHSARLQKKEPVYTYDELIEPSTYKRRRSTDNNSDLEDIVFKPKKSRGTTKPSERDILPVEAVTEEMINSIAKSSDKKVYTDLGTSCHQCRQKTGDQKTCCRNTNCIGVRGQFCGICLKNRYGENAAVALRDPNWHCPVCRGICNCSFCRTKAGKRPTGILTPFALQKGHKSVMDFLDSLKEKGDSSDKDNLHPKESPHDLLGFANVTNAAHTRNNSIHQSKALLQVDKLKKICDELKKEIQSLIDNYYERYGLLGFPSNSDCALMATGDKYEMEPRLLIGRLNDLIGIMQSDLPEIPSVDLSEASTEVLVDATPEVSVKATPEVSVEATPKVSAEATPAVLPNISFEVLPEVSSDVTFEVPSKALLANSLFIQRELKSEIDIEEPTLSYVGGLCGECRKTFEFCVCYMLALDVYVKEEPQTPPIAFASVSDFLDVEIKDENSNDFLDDLGASDPLSITGMDCGNKNPWVFVMPKQEEVQSMSYALEDFEIFYKKQAEVHCLMQDDAFEV